MDSSRLILYGTCVLGAIGVYLLLRRGKPALSGVGALLGLGAFGMLLMKVGHAVAGSHSNQPEYFFLVFAALALFSSIKLITSSRPVYSALYFVLVVISSAGLFLLLASEFMTFALVIVYAGAILITYLFVLMLAQQTPVAGVRDQGAAEYDVNPREPAAAVVVGFLLLASLGDMLMRSPEQWPVSPSVPVTRMQAWHELEEMPQLLRERIQQTCPDLQWPPDPDDRGRIVRFDSNGAFVKGRSGEGTVTTRFDLPAQLGPDNTRRVGWALVAKFPVSLELAGVILTMAMFGAVVLARRQIELDEDEKRQAAGMRRLSPDAIDAAEHQQEGPL